MNYYMLWTKVTKGYRLAIFPLILQKEMSPIAGLQKRNFPIFYPTTKNDAGTRKMEIQKTEIRRTERMEIRSQSQIRT